MGRQQLGAALQRPQFCCCCACLSFPILPSSIYPTTFLPAPPATHLPSSSLPCSYNALLADRAELEARYEARLHGAEAASAAQLAALDGQFQQKLLHEMDRYAELAAGKEALNARWVRQGGAEWMLQKLVLPIFSALCEIARFGTQFLRHWHAHRR